MKYQNGATANFNGIFIIPTDPEMRADIEAIDKVTRKECFDKYNITLPYDFMANTIVTCFLENMVKMLAYKMQTQGSEAVTININDVIECHATCRHVNSAEKEGNINIVIRPGVNAKLLIKSDDLTEYKES